LISKASYKFILNNIIEFDNNHYDDNECDSHATDVIDKLNLTRSS